MSNKFCSSKNISFHESKINVATTVSTICYDDNRSFGFHILYDPNTDEVKLKTVYDPMENVRFRYDVHVTEVKEEDSDEVYKRITIYNREPLPTKFEAIDLIYKDGKLKLERVATSEDLLNERAADAIKESDILFLIEHADNLSMSYRFGRYITCGREVAEAVYNAISAASFPSEEGELSPLEKALLVHDAIMRTDEE